MDNYDAIFEEIYEELKEQNEIKEKKEIERIVESVNSITAQALSGVSTNLRRKIRTKPTRDKIVSYASSLKKKNHKDAKMVALESYDILLQLNSDEKKEFHRLLESYQF